MTKTMNGWSFGGHWPYQPRWYAKPDGRMHYIDEGPRDSRPVVLLHGNPAWGSFTETSSAHWSKLAIG